ncbi:hypothetical protein [Blastomonas sp.]|uniref:hypothetical protein n=1 Tax=Blastomonas sp. TaxID=1909299 RepID=UPI003592FEF9
MESAYLYLTLAMTALLAIALISATVLRGWREWLAFKRHEIDTHGRSPGGGSPSTTSRIEIADLKERIRKLEAIAAGVEL